MTVYGYARVSTDGQTLDAQLKELRSSGAERVFREKVSGALTERAQLRRAIASLSKGDVVLVTRLDRLARSTRDLLNILAEIAQKGAGFRSLRNSWADTTTAHGRLMLTVLAGLAEFERELIRSSNWRRAGAGQGSRCAPWKKAKTHPASTTRSSSAARCRGADRRNRAFIRRLAFNNFQAALTQEAHGY